MNLELINSSTYALCVLMWPLSTPFNSTAKTSFGGFRPSMFALFHRLSLAMPMQGY